MDILATLCAYKARIENENIQKEIYSNIFSINNHWSFLQ